MKEQDVPFSEIKRHVLLFFLVCCFSVEIVIHPGQEVEFSRSSHMKHLLRDSTRAILKEQTGQVDPDKVLDQGSNALSWMLYHLVTRTYGD